MLAAVVGSSSLERTKSTPCRVLLQVYQLDEVSEERAAQLVAALQAQGSYTFLRWSSDGSLADLSPESFVDLESGTSKRVCISE